MLKLIVNIKFFFFRDKFKFSIAENPNTYTWVIADASTNNIVSSFITDNPTAKNKEIVRYVSKLTALAALKSKGSNIYSVHADVQNFKNLSMQLNSALLKNNEMINKELYKGNKTDSEVVKQYIINNEEILHDFNEEISKIIN